jgi:hypothetical protein
MIESLFHAGDLDFKEPELSALLELARRSRRCSSSTSSGRP